MIITKTPFRVSFVGGGSDIKDYYQKGYGSVVGDLSPRDIKYSLLDVSEVIGFCYNVRYYLEEELMSTPKIFGGIDSQSARPAELLYCQASRHSRNIKVR